MPDLAPTVAYRPGSLSEILTEHYRRAHGEAIEGRKAAEVADQLAGTRSSVTHPFYAGSQSRQAADCGDAPGQITSVRGRPVRPSRFQDARSLRSRMRP